MLHLVRMQEAGCLTFPHKPVLCRIVVFLYSRRTVLLEAHNRQYNCEQTAGTGSPIAAFFSDIQLAFGAPTFAL